MCRMQPDENLARLQKCLVGGAREKVQSLLTLPSAIPEIINTLRDECGRPEQLVHCLLAKVRNTPLPDVRKLETLVAFGREVRNLVTYIEASNLHAHLSNPLLLAELINRLPTNLRLDWGLYSQRIPEITLKAFSDFAMIIKTAACQVNIPTDYNLPEHSSRHAPRKEKGGFVNAHFVEDQCKTSQSPERTNGILNDDPNTVLHTKQNSDPKPCHVCQRKDHKIRDCKNFLDLTIYERVKYVKEHNLCGRCLTGHGKWPCRTKQPCGVDECKEMHHRLLHLKPENTRGAIISTHSQQQTSSLFKIVPVTLRNKDKSVDTFAFFDDGSDLMLLDNGLADELGLVGIESPLCLQWTSNITRNEPCSKRVQLMIGGSDGKADYCLKNVRTVENLSLPKQNLNYENLANQFPFLRGLPVKSYSEAIPGILIGVDNAWLKLPLKKRDRRETEPVAIKTRLGWTIFGGQRKSIGPERCTVHICNYSRDHGPRHLIKDEPTIEYQKPGYVHKVTVSELRKSQLPRSSKRCILSLPTCAKRRKWVSEILNNEDDLDVVADESAQKKWLRGNVIKAYKASDNQEREVDIQTRSSATTGDIRGCP
ncbi:uncharacterized protein LOC128735553 [Sabethes cyaneus]|uniref:uncharacterized protein LOC128735553 n=1 Tax=Sabethes cyaneus TaxID=53552 RepID=UPI00237DFB69|nr:uncharacterized protein LOC128735553 [Sabethes cyaneus]